MTEFSSLHWVIVVVLMLFFTGVPLVAAFLIGMKVGDKNGYTRGFREGQQSVPGK
jgi:hypothetical protein